MTTFPYQRPLIILPERLGDSLFHTPAIRLLKTQRPGLYLGVIALSALCADVLKNNPFIDALHIAPRMEEVKRLGANYDVVLVLHDHEAARRCASWTGLPVVKIEMHVAGSRHRSQNSFDFVGRLLEISSAGIDNRYNLYPTQEHENRIQKLFDEYEVKPDDILIGCHIGCHSIAKRGLKFWRPLEHPKVWPLENFIALQNSLRKTDPRFRFVLTGSKGERKLGEKFMRAVPDAINLVDRTSVLDLAALMRRLNLFISSDTGALHVACASGVGLIALFGPTDIEVTGPHPMQPNYSVLQNPDLARITVAQVAAAIFAHPDIAQLMR